LAKKGARGRRRGGAVKGELGSEKLRGSITCFLLKGGPGKGDAKEGDDPTPTLLTPKNPGQEGDGRASKMQSGKRYSKKGVKERDRERCQVRSRSTRAYLFQVIEGKEA